MKKISWWQAYRYLWSIVFDDNKVKIANRAAFILAHAFPIAMLVLVPSTMQHLGDIPPNVPVISATGNIRYIWQRKTDYCVFDSDDGHSYPMPQYVNAEVRDLCRETTRTQPKHIYLEWFVLQNGKGPIWPMKIVLNDGKTYVDQTFQLKAIQTQKEFDIKEWLFIAALEILLVIFAYRLLATHMRKLETET